MLHNFGEMSPREILLAFKYIYLSCFTVLTLYMNRLTIFNEFCWFHLFSTIVLYLFLVQFCLGNFIYIIRKCMDNKLCVILWRNWYCYRRHYIIIWNLLALNNFFHILNFILQRIKLFLLHTYSYWRKLSITLNLL